LTVIRDGTLSNSFITIKIGSDRKDYQVHKDLICFHFPYFDAAFNGKFKEGEEGVLELAATEESIFWLFLDWLYFGKLPERILCSDENDDGEAEEGEDDEYDPSPAYELHVFADRYNVPELRRALMEKIRSAWKAQERCLPSNEEITWLFNALPESSTLCKLVVDLFAYRFDPAADEKRDIKARSQLPWNVLLKLVLRTAEVRATYAGNMDFDGNCGYHEHVTAEEREACESGDKEQD